MTERGPIERRIDAANAGAAVLLTVPGVTDDAIEEAREHIEAAIAYFAHNIARAHISEPISGYHQSIAAALGTAIEAIEEERKEEIAGPSDGFCADLQSIEEYQRDSGRWQGDLSTARGCLERLKTFHERRGAYWADPAMKPLTSDNPARTAFCHRLADIYCGAKGIDRAAMTISDSNGSPAMNFIVAVVGAVYDGDPPSRRSILRWLGRKV